MICRNTDKATPLASWDMTLAPKPKYARGPWGTHSYFCFRNYNDSVLLLHKRERIERIREQGGQIVSVRHQKPVSFWLLSITTVLSSFTHSQYSNDTGDHNNIVFTELKVGRTPALGPLLLGRSDQFGSPAAAVFMLIWSIALLLFDSLLFRRAARN